MSLKGKKIAILAEADYQDLEVWFPYLRLLEESADVVIVGTGSAKQYKGKYGYPLDVHAAAAEVSAATFDGIIVPGGWAPDRLRQYPAVLDLVRAIDAEGKLVGAICHAGWVLASAGICRGRTLTSFKAIRDDLVHAGATWVDQEVVRDKNLVTSRTPWDLPAFMKVVLAVLEEPTAKAKTSKRG